MHKALANLWQQLNNAFNLDELNHLCYELGIDSENLGGDTKLARARELVLYVSRRGDLDKLIAKCEEQRPNLIGKFNLDAAPTSLPPMAAVDPDVMARRREAYHKLYHILKSFARYDLPEPVTVDTLKQVSLEMRDWYFDIGGLYLTDHCREPYFDLKENSNKRWRCRNTCSKKSLVMLITLPS